MQNLDRTSRVTKQYVISFTKKLAITNKYSNQFIVHSLHTITDEYIINTYLLIDDNDEVHVILCMIISFFFFVQAFNLSH